MSEETAKASVDFLMLKSRDLRSVRILCFGGEPLLEFDLVRLIADYGKYQAGCANKQLTISLTTNGTLVTEEMMAFFRLNGIMILVSIDGSEDIHNYHRSLVNGQGSYNLIAERISLMKQYQPWLGARVTPTPATMGYLSKSIKYLHETGFNQFLIGPATGMHYSQGDAALFTREMIAVGDYYISSRKQGVKMRISSFERENNLPQGSFKGIWGCGGGKGRISVSTTGDIQPCAKIQGLNLLKGLPQFSLGNVYTGFSHLDRRRDFINPSHASRVRCLSCDIADECTGGCAAANYQATKYIYSPDPNECRLTRAWIEVKRSVLARLEEEGIS